MPCPRPSLLFHRFSSPFSISTPTNPASELLEGSSLNRGHCHICHLHTPNLRPRLRSLRSLFYGPPPQSHGPLLFVFKVMYLLTTSLASKSIHLFPSLSASSRSSKLARLPFSIGPITACNSLEIM